MPAPVSSPRIARTLNRSLVLVLFAANLALAGCQSSPSTPPPEAVADSDRQSAADRAEAPREHDEERLQSLLERSWWREPEPLDALRLTSGQQQSLDALFESSWHQQRSLRDEIEQLQSEFAVALEQGDLDAAQARADDVAASITALQRGELALRIDGIAVLTDAQRELVASRYPHLLSRPWLRFRSSRGAR